MTWGLFSVRTAAIGAATIVFVAACVAPLIAMLGLSLGSSSVTAVGYEAVLLDARQRGLLYNTTSLGLLTAALATVIGVPLGVALARIELPWKPLWRVLLSAPILLPPYVAALAWLSLAGGAGLLSQFAGGDVLLAWTYSLPGAVLVLTLVFYPLSMVATEVAVRRIEPHLEEAALLVTSPRRVLWRITLRLAAPGITAAALLIFVLAVSEFGVPGLLRVRVFTTEVFTAFAALYDFGRASLLAVPLLLISIAVAALAVAVVGGQLVTTRRGLANGNVATLQAWKYAAVAAAASVVTIALLVPLALLLREARDVRSWISIVEGSSVAIGNSLLFATIGATLAVCVGLVLGYARARSGRWTGMLADVTCVALFSVPSTIVGIGLIALWNRPGVLGAVYGTDAMLLLGYLARFLPVSALGIAAAFQHVPTSHEEAASTAGAGWTRTMTHIVVPQVSTGLVAAWVVIFVLAFGELGASILVAPPGETTLPIRIYTLIANAPPAQVAALALLQTVVTLTPLLLLAWAAAARKPR
jgi:iron(III) transport system permease protein